MKGLKLSNGDLSITNNEIDFVFGNELTAQTIQSVLSTNKGENMFDIEEGIDFDNILGKHGMSGDNVTNQNIILNEIEQGIAQVDDTLVLDKASFDYNSKKRKLLVKYVAKTRNEENIEIENEWS